MLEDLVLLELNTRWNCDIPFGWVPITKPAENSEELEIYDAISFIDWFGDKFKTLVANTFEVASVYEIAEGGRVTFTQLEECRFKYDGAEYMYTDAAFSFLIYFSHESSVTVSSSLLLREIHRVWPTYKSHFYHSG